MKVEIDNDVALDMLQERLEFWTQDKEIIDLYMQMYESYVDGGIFDGGPFNVMEIVDNDYVNWCRIILKGEEDFEELYKIYIKQGLGDCSCETRICSYIEAVNDDENVEMFLIRE